MRSPENMSAPSSTPADARAVDAGTLAAARDLTKVWPDGTRALGGVACSVSAGRIIALVGPNGSGKTTLLRLLAGNLEPSAGELSIFGSTLVAGRSLPRSIRARIGYLAQDLQLDPDMTGRETLALFATLYGSGRERRSACIASVAEALDLGAHLEQRSQLLSGGLRRRLHIAAALVAQPDLLFLDEPWAGLDVHSGALLWNEVRRRAEAGSGIVLVTHELADVERHADEVWILNAGAIVAKGSPAELASARGARFVSLELAGDPLEAEQLRTRLAERIDPASVSGEGRRFRIALEHPTSTERQVLEALGQSGLDLASFETHRADLAGAYLASTGSRPGPGKTRGRQGGRRKGGGAS